MNDMLKTSIIYKNISIQKYSSRSEWNHATKKKIDQIQNIILFLFSVYCFSAWNSKENSNENSDL